MTGSIPQYHPIISTRDIDDILEGEDIARPLLEASSSGDDATLQSLLLQPKWIEIMLDFPLVINEESRPRESPDDAREVWVHNIQNFERAFRFAVQNHHAAVLSMLKTFSSRQGIPTSEFMPKHVMSKMIADKYDWVWEALATVDPEIVYFPCIHGKRVLYEAVKRRQTYVVYVLLNHGADPLRSVQKHEKLGTYNSSLMSLAAMSKYSNMIEMLLEHGATIAGTAALHTAAAFGRLDTMRVLIKHGADMDEVDPKWCQRTPMHFAAERLQEEAMKLLEDSGARSDITDYENDTPAQLLEAMKLREAGASQ